MLRILTFFVFIISISGNSSAQSQLLACINCGPAPVGTDSIQQVVPYIDSSSLFINGGYQPGNPVADFIVYDTSGNALQLSQLITDNKPVLLISGSRTCPAYRYTAMQIIPSLVNMFASQVNILVVYQLETHPVTPDVSPFSGTVWTMQQNYTDNVLIRQHNVYDDRINCIKQTILNEGSSCPIYADGPGNEYWQNFGPSPNNAYLLRPDGTVYNKYGWIEDHEADVINDIQQLLLAGTGISTETVYPLSSIANPASDNSELKLLQSGVNRVIIFSGNGSMVSDRVYYGQSIVPVGNLLTSDGTFILYIENGDVSERRLIVRSNSN